MSQSTVQSLFAGAQAGGDLSAQAVQVLNIPDLGAQIQAGLGVSVDDVMASEVLLVTLLIDDSGSIRSAGNEQVIRDGVNLILRSLSGSKQSDGVLMSIRYLNGTVLTPYASLDQIPKLDDTNYEATGGTPLYDQSIVVCGQSLAKCQEFADSGCAARSVTVFVTDGADICSRRSAADVAKVVRDMRITENHIVIGVGIDDSEKDASGQILRKGTDYQNVFLKMGVDPKWILTPGNSESEIRKAFAVVSQSAVRASQGTQGFSQAAGAGFTG